MIDIVRDFLLEPVILIGVIVFIGLVLQRKGFEVVVKGTLKAMIGFMIISIGGNIISEAVASFGLMIQRGFHTTGLILMLTKHCSRDYVKMLTANSVQYLV